MKKEDLKRMIMEELNRIREERGFTGLEVSALNDADEEVVSMRWAREPDLNVLAKTLVSTYMMSGVESLRTEEGEDWLMSNIGAFDEKDRNIAREAFGMSRFSDDQMDRDRQLGGYDIDDEDIGEAKGEKGDANPLGGKRAEFDLDHDGVPDGGDADKDDPDVQQEADDVEDEERMHQRISKAVGIVNKVKDRQSRDVYARGSKPYSRKAKGPRTGVRKVRDEV
jgi:hypothetical protein